MKGEDGTYVKGPRRLWTISKRSVIGMPRPESHVPSETSNEDAHHTPRAMWRATRSSHIASLRLVDCADDCAAFFLHAIFFTFALCVDRLLRIAADHIGWYIAPFAAGNFLGPLLLGRLFDTLGRRAMITLTYGGVVGLFLLALSGYLFAIGCF